MITTQEIIVGQVHRVPYPYCWDTFIDHPDNGPGVETDTWRPGIKMQAEDGPCCPHDGPEYVAVAHGMGFMLAEVISVHKPGRFPERVFYTRAWEAPDGKTFGKPKLRITTTAAFRRLIKGYRYEFELVEEDGPAKTAPATMPEVDDMEVPF